MSPNICKPCPRTEQKGEDDERNKGPSRRPVVSPQLSTKRPDFSTAPLRRVLRSRRVIAPRKWRGAIRPSVPQLEAVKPREAPDNGTPALWMTERQRRFPF